MKKITALFSGVLFMGSLMSLTGDWKTSVTTMLADFQSCSTAKKGAECKTYCAKAIKTMYGVNDFDAAGKPGGMLDVNGVANYIKKSSNWKLLGDAGTQDILTQAETLANGGKAVVAMMETDNGASHISIIAPGSLVSCGKAGLKCPNSVSFFINSPDRSYVGKPLAYSFKTLEGIKIYARN